MGFHVCEYSHSGDNRYPETSSGDVLLVFKNGHKWTMPDMILHYVADHGWQPPAEFVRDVMTQELNLEDVGRMQTRNFSIGDLFNGTRVGYLAGSFNAGHVPDGFIERLKKYMNQASLGGNRAQTKSLDLK
jgi:hypothetical protein